MMQNSDDVLSQISVVPDKLILQTSLRNEQSKQVFFGPSAPGKLKTEAEKNLRNLQDNGYPFASFRFDTITFDGTAGALSGTLDQGPRILNGALIIHGDSSISTKLMARLTGFRKDDDFSLSRAERIPLLLKAIPYASLIKQPELEWFGNQAILHLHLRRIPANTFNGILGLLPRQGNGNQLLLTGNVDAGFSDLFRRGISFTIRWARFAPSSQQAFLALEWPALTFSGLGFSGRFELFRQDSLYFFQKAGVEMLLPFTGLWKIRTGLQSFQSSQKGIGSNLAVAQSVNSLVFGADMENAPPNGINPSRNFFSFRFLPGLKIREEGKSTSRKSQLEFRAKAQAALFRLGNRFWMRGNGDIGALFSDGLTVADQFRMGGLRSLRGFNENQFFTSRHVLLGLQPSYLLDSGFLIGLLGEALFFDSGFLMLSPGAYQAAVGFGVIAEFEAGSNLIQLAMANGWMKGLRPELSSSKIHFGYVARF